MAYATLRNEGSYVTPVKKSISFSTCWTSLDPSDFAMIVPNRALRWDLGSLHMKHWYIRCWTVAKGPSTKISVINRESYITIMQSSSSLFTFKERLNADENLKAFNTVDFWIREILKCVEFLQFLAFQSQESTGEKRVSGIIRNVRFCSFYTNRYLFDIDCKRAIWAWKYLWRLENELEMAYLNLKKMF